MFCLFPPTKVSKPDFYIIIKLKKIMSLNISVVDAGARYGLHPTWAELRGIVNFHLFEMDNNEAAS